MRIRLGDEVEVEEPIFRSVNHALAFAHNFTHGTLKRSAMAKMMGGDNPTGKGLAGLDGAAQAGMIKRALRALPDLYRFTLIARFAPQTEPCSCRRACCRGWRETAEWSESIAWLAEHILSQGLTGNIGHLRFRKSVLERYFGGKVSFLTIAKECGVHRDTASQLNTKVVDYFRGLRLVGKKERAEERGVEWHARTEFEANLYERGVV